ncbi:MAG: hypothetical protein ACREJU_01080 [Nitrospiraceae bacterium]
MDVLQRLFGSSGFEPHGRCLLWEQNVLWFNVVSDAIIALTYYSIPAGLMYVVRKRQDLPFHWMFIMFGACGTTRGQVEVAV